MTKQLILSALLATAVVSGSAFAQEMTAFPEQNYGPGKSRAEVRAETLEARKHGAFEQTLSSYSGFKVEADRSSEKSRAEVRQEVKEEFRQARAHGERLASGEASNG